ncbi:hypothetical protein E2C01_064487 [Portunus trituberculatus]|uniref:Uncharacterized protein n=1 Tax=Portunus trituberculatus TaxID=210409 RepID=A0A5B7HKZ2_PORTR|nr:hypothetical protein [Portunus trituberculatus]
MPPSHRLVK